MYKTTASTGKVVILNSGFCVLQGLIELKKIGVFASALIKKRRYWPKHVPGELIDEFFEELEVGESDSLYGVLDGIPYNIFCMKEPDYVMKVMSTYGGLVVKEGQKESTRKYEKNGAMHTKTFKYTVPFSNHFDFCHCIDDHNNLRHQVPSIEGTWKTHRWATRVFSFILAVAEVNTFLAFKHFIWDGAEKKTLAEFRSDLAWGLIDNIHLDSEDEVEPVKKKKRRRIEHKLLTAPKRCVKFDGQKWIKKGKLEYP